MNGRARRISALLVLVVGGALVVPATGLGVRTEAVAAPLTAASAAALRDTSADEGRSVPAYLDGATSDRVVRVFSVSFWGRVGERRLVAARIEAHQPSTTSDRLLMASVSLTCSPATRGASSAGSTQNLLRGTTTVLSPRFVYVVPRTGRVSCTLSASGLRPRPAAGPTRSNTWTVGLRSALAVGAPLPAWARTVTSGARSRVLDRGESWVPVSLLARVSSDLRSFRIVSDHKVTTCSAVGGSRDTSTLGRELCDGRVSTTGSVVRVTVTAVQLGRDRRPCATAQRSVTDRTVRAVVHHQMVASAVPVAVSASRACTPVFRIQGRLSLVRGADVVIHAPSARTLLLPR